MSVLIIIFAVLIASTVYADHEHYTAEVSRLTTSGGLVYNKDFRSTADAQDDYASLDGITFGDTGSPYYDETLDGTVIPITCDEFQHGTTYESNGQFTPVDGTIWIQWEMNVDQNFIDDLPIAIADGDAIPNTKLFRIGAISDKCTCGNNPDNRLNTHYVYYIDGNVDWVWHGEEANCLWSDDNFFMDDASSHGDIWFRWTHKMNLSTGQIETWRTNISTSATTKTADVLNPDFCSGVKIDGAYPLIHITALHNHGWAACPGNSPYKIAYRNIIVADEEIQLNNTSESHGGRRSTAEYVSGGMTVGN